MKTAETPNWTITELLSALSKQGAKVVTANPDARYVFIFDEGVVPSGDITRLGEVLHNMGIVGCVIVVDGNPNEVVAVIEVQRGEKGCQR